ncbi:tRNA (adenosine(37)-N6)-threonylcarbamoyltransferase complex transferase subunit TsaD [Candidatus Campbellbacteria bacterium]|nr:MAG: tRNA (adenosine(37)-N6)-threonylcarbamoyltransferase complex transferase subunit TsaD [Candidatus Campbellbacteria bacterium]
MKILSIESSCDETAMSIVNFGKNGNFTVLSDTVLSQVEIHKNYGGVFPTLAKREHTNNIFPLLVGSLKTAKMLQKRKRIKKITSEQKKELQKLFKYDTTNLENIISLYQNYKVPKLDAVAVTYGPGLEIALWIGFNIAKALCILWDKKFVPTNHMEGHIYASLIQHLEKNKYKVSKVQYPVLSVLISGGHTELVLSKRQHHYKILGQTLDDAVGEVYDKSARLLGFHYPGGPEISKLSEKFRTKVKNSKRKIENEIKLPRPMLKSPDFNFSFSGLKTAVLYKVKEQKKITKSFKEKISYEFENAVSEVLISKSKKAIEKYKVKTLLIGGGVSANKKLRGDFKKLTRKQNVDVFIPDVKYTGDNGLMIAVAGFYNTQKKNFSKMQKTKSVNGNLKIK